MSHLACTRHKRRVLIIEVPVVPPTPGHTQWEAIHREDASDCNSTAFKSGEKALTDSDILDLLEREGARELLRNIFIDPEEGAWQCGDGHMFRYEPPPASPPFCGYPGCFTSGFRWILKDEVTGRDWLPD